MRDILINIFKDDIGGPMIRMYNWVHILYLLIILGVTALVYYLMKDKPQEKKSLVLMDIMMPELDGFSAVREIKKIYDVPVIMLSARTSNY